MFVRRTQSSINSISTCYPPVVRRRTNRKALRFPVFFSATMRLAALPLPGDIVFVLRTHRRGYPARTFRGPKCVLVEQKFRVDGTRQISGNALLYPSGCARSSVKSKSKRNQRRRNLSGRCRFDRRWEIPGSNSNPGRAELFATNFGYDYPTATPELQDMTLWNISCISD